MSMALDDVRLQKRPRIEPELVRTIASAKRGEVPPQDLVKQEEQLTTALGDEGFERLLSLATINGGYTASF